MSRCSDMIGRKFGHLTVTRLIPRKKGEYSAVCRCDCPNHTELIVALSRLLKRHIGSFGLCKQCNQAALHDLTGRKFGRLIVLERVPGSFTTTRWKCQCSCKDKTIVEVTGNNLVTGHTLSCGCLQKERSSQSHIKFENRDDTIISSRLYQMRARCYNPKDKLYKHYGARGITMCDEWLDKDNGSINFVKWFKSQPNWDPDLEVDRIDNNGPYAPWNCRLATRREQMNNCRSNVNVTIKGETHTVSEWSRLTGIPSWTLYRRLERGLDAFVDCVFQSGYFLKLKGETYGKM